MEEILLWCAGACWAAVWPVLGYGIGKRRERASYGLVMGLLLGPLGCAITYARSPKQTADPIAAYKRWKEGAAVRHMPCCPYCSASTPGSGLVTCPSCRRQFESA